MAMYGSWLSRGCTQLSQVPGVIAWTAGLMAGLLSSALTTVSCFLKGASGLRIGESSKSVPSFAGVH